MAGPPEQRIVLDEQAGLRDGTAELRARLAQAPPGYLEGAFRNPRLGQAEMPLMLRNPVLTPGLLTKIARDSRWMRVYELKKRVVRHPQTPLAVARNLTHHLYWKDLADAAGDSRAHPTLRRQSEDLLRTRMAQLALGERISLARRATAGLIEPLLELQEGPVLEALLNNPALRRRDAEQIASGGGTSPEVLLKLADHPRWSSQPLVRVALAANPRTPVSVALRTLRKMTRQELERLAKQPETPKIVLVGADRCLEEGRMSEPDHGPREE